MAAATARLLHPAAADLGWLLHHSIEVLIRIPGEHCFTYCECCLQASRRRKAAAAAWSGARQANAHARDFTVNSLMYDPFDSVLYDYTGESGSVLVLCHMRQCASDFELVCTGSVCTL